MDKTQDKELELRKLAPKRLSGRTFQSSELLSGWNWTKRKLSPMDFQVLLSKICFHRVLVF